MNDGRPENDVTGTRRGRSPLVVTTVAAAVLLAGGGAAYWASNASGGGTADTGPAAAGDAAAPLLALDRADGPTGPPPGIAPGEPDPNGGVVYRASGELPEGPASAAVRRAGGTVTAAEVARLAEALGVPGAPRSDGTAWKVGSDGDGSGPVLRVIEQAPGTWTFDRYATGGSDACESARTCAKQAPAPQSGSPVDEKTAKAAAAPMLKAAGQDDASLDARQLMGSVRVVNADPVVDGLPTYGWSTGIQVGADGEVVGGSGNLKGLEKSDSYPVIGADEALAQLNAESRRSAKGGPGDCATPVPLEDGSTPTAGCGAPGTQEPVTVEVDDAEFGLSAQYAGGEQILVPSWLFSVRPDDGGPTHTVVRVAVHPDHLTPRSTPPAPEPTKDPGAGSTGITSYSAEGRTLEVTFWGGVCSTYTARATESGSAVRVTVTESEREPGKACVMIAKELTRKVTLDTPLGERTVVDAGSGARVPHA
ncbi:hypothetical protein ACFYY2_33535 [Streptomyces sp. NPDC001822]|uniref:hypothetical protein n=1 Tax=Streptomyces sp. NPDC001822 TaxID=3364614 RepID=UPI0036B53F7F